jgi:murein DD-endopeptidase MepM/ murein hydrolase activator NlpD
MSGSRGEMVEGLTRMAAAAVTVAVALGTTGAAPAEPSGVPVTGPSLATRADAGPAYGTYSWPVVGSVLRPFEPPAGPFGAGHRGIDISAPVGTVVRASGDGVVAFAGRVAGSLFVSIDHPDGVRTTYSWLSAVTVRAGDPVSGGAVIATSGPGHPGTALPHLHFGARYQGDYLDPLLLLGGASLVGLIRLAPLEDVTPGV